MAVPHSTVYICRVGLAMLTLALLVNVTTALRGLGLPNRELFMEKDTPANVPANSSTSSGTTSQNTTSSGLTMSGLKDELDSFKEQLEEKEEQHSKATIAAAATIGSLLLVAAMACAGVLIYRRFVSSQHAGHKKGHGSKQPYYDADRLLGDAAGL